jgi:translocator assembly and maintenance protein 41
MFAVSHPAHFHSINMARNPKHYPLAVRMLGSDFVDRMQSIGPGVWFNPYVTVNGVVGLSSFSKYRSI